ncbi:hypothetical protein FPQ18DRAFT_117758 [Pyronema domesticum]|nr:hypothetical protein FPQ18DRAFT_117758 [Pyronema domesticum]
MASVITNIRRHLIIIYLHLFPRCTGLTHPSSTSTSTTVKAETPLLFSSLSISITVSIASSSSPTPYSLGICTLGRSCRLCDTLPLCLRCLFSLCLCSPRRPCRFLPRFETNKAPYHVYRNARMYVHPVIERSEKN